MIDKMKIKKNTFKANIETKSTQTQTHSLSNIEVLISLFY
jgi:hypothetical protein